MKGKKSMLTNANNNANIFFCEECGKGYKHRSSYSRHRRLCVTYTGYNCDYCGKHYKHKSSYSRHMRECVNMLGVQTGVSNEMEEMRKMVKDIMKENKELQNKLVEIAKEPKVFTQNYIEQTNIQKFNIIHYLNHDCKHAMNIQDFMEHILVTFEDLDKIEQHGYLKNLHDNLVVRLKNMEQNMRPIQCTDVKRGQFYVKDKNQWDKDKDHEKIEDVIKGINNSHMKLLKEWTDANPSWTNQEDKVNKVNIVLNGITSLYMDEGKQLKKKILQDLGKVTHVEKKDDIK